MIREIINRHEKAIVLMYLQEILRTGNSRSADIKDEQVKVKFPKHGEVTHQQIKRVTVGTCSRITILARILLELLGKHML